jgi:sugar O-acyltransferase (sialic acid O-acetyltransferase NeuD family)
MPRAPVIVFGAGQVAEVVRFYLEHDSAYRVCAFTVDAEYVQESHCQGLPVLAFDEVTQAFPPNKYGIFVALSFKQVNKIRAAKFVMVKAAGYHPINYVSSKSATWPGLVIGENTFIMENNTIQPFVTIGDNTILWSGNHLGHHSTIGNHCFIASQAVISGSVKVGDFSFIGVNATIRDNVNIGRSCVIGAGTLILEDTKDFEVYQGPRTEPSKVPSNRLRGI